MAGRGIGLHMLGIRGLRRRHGGHGNALEQKSQSEQSVDQKPWRVHCPLTVKAVTRFRNAIEPAQVLTKSFRNVWFHTYDLMYGFWLWRWEWMC